MSFVAFFKRYETFVFFFHSKRLGPFLYDISFVRFWNSSVADYGTARPTFLLREMPDGELGLVGIDPSWKDLEATGGTVDLNNIPEAPAIPGNFKLK